MRHPHPDHAAPTLPHRTGEPVDRRHDIERRRAHRMPDLGVHKRMLHVDDDKRRLRRVQRSVAMLAAAPPDDAGNDDGIDRGAVELHRDASPPLQGSWSPRRTPGEIKFSGWRPRRR